MKIIVILVSIKSPFCSLLSPKRKEKKEDDNLTRLDCSGTKNLYYFTFTFMAISLLPPPLTFIHQFALFKSHNTMTDEMN